MRGALDREIVRRVVRRHLADVKHCYDQGLRARPALGGRLTVQFTIEATGRVVTSALAASTVGDARVESCFVQAVRGWELPKPLDGRAVLVDYPFLLQPAPSAAASGTFP